MVKRFELNWQNPIVRFYFNSILPLIALSIVLFTTLTSEWYFIPNGLLIIGTITFFIRYLRHKKSNE